MRACIVAVGVLVGFGACGDDDGDDPNARPDSGAVATDAGERDVDSGLADRDAGSTEVAADGSAGDGGSAVGDARVLPDGFLCPPCVPPPSPACVGSGPCGCGPYTCPDGATGFPPTR